MNTGEPYHMDPSILQKRGLGAPWLAVLLAAVPGIGGAQNYALEGVTSGSGGCTGTSGVAPVIGAIGQPAAGGTKGIFAADREVRRLDGTIGRGDFPNAVLQGSTPNFQVYVIPELGEAGGWIRPGSNPNPRCLTAALDADAVSVPDRR